MNSHVVETSSLFNEEKQNLFQEKGAVKIFLDPIGLYTQFPSLHFGSDRSQLSDEVQFFKALHFVRYRLARALQNQEQDNIQKIEYWYKLSIYLRNRIASANLGLVYGCMKRTSIIIDTNEMLSAGNAALIRSVEKYNPWLGNKFSTYACTAILHRFKTLTKKRNWTGIDISELEPPALEAVDADIELRKDRVQAAIKGAGLTSREKEVIFFRFYGNDRLIDVGNRYDLSKERIRQIQIRALDKLRRVLEVDPALNS